LSINFWRTNKQNEEETCSEISFTPVEYATKCEKHPIHSSESTIELVIKGSRDYIYRIAIGFTMQVLGAILIRDWTLRGDRIVSLVGSSFEDIFKSPRDTVRSSIMSRSLSLLRGAYMAYKRYRHMKSVYKSAKGKEYREISWARKMRCSIPRQRNRDCNNIV